MTWSHKAWMWDISESEISVPMESSAAALRIASRSSGRMAAKSVVAAFVRKPLKRGYQGSAKQKKLICIAYIPIRRITFA